METNLNSLSKDVSQRSFFASIRADFVRARDYAHGAAQCRGLGLKWSTFVRFFLPWRRSFQENNLSAQAVPWFPFPAIEFMKRTVRREWVIFEFGSGGSTIFFAQRCSQVYSVEHDSDWAESVRTAAKNIGISNLVLRLIAPDYCPEDEGDRENEGYRSDLPMWKDYSFSRYVNSIGDHADHSLDVIVIDGRARAACFRRSIRKVRPGGLLILDDSSRTSYQKAISIIPKTWKRIDFTGPYPRDTNFDRATIWTSPK